MTPGDRLNLTRVGTNRRGHLAAMLKLALDVVLPFSARPLDTATVTRLRQELARKAMDLEARDGRSTSTLWIVLSRDENAGALVEEAIRTAHGWLNAPVPTVLVTPPRPASPNPFVITP
jgi:hypothetical protein